MQSTLDAKPLTIALGFLAATLGNDTDQSHDDIKTCVTREQQSRFLAQKTRFGMTHLEL